MEEKGYDTLIIQPDTKHDQLKLITLIMSDEELIKWNLHIARDGRELEDEEALWQFVLMVDDDQKERLLDYVAHRLNAYHIIADIS